MGKCELFEQHISDMFDNELPQPLLEETQAHIESCDDCRSFYNFMSTIYPHRFSKLDAIPDDGKMILNIKDNITFNKIVQYKRRNVKFAPVALLLCAAVAVVAFVITGKMGDIVTFNPIIRVQEEPLSASHTEGDSVLENNVYGEVSNITYSEKIKTFFLGDVEYTIPAGMKPEPYAFYIVVEGNSMDIDSMDSKIYRSQAGDMSFFTVKNTIPTLEKVINSLENAEYEPIILDSNHAAIDSTAENGLVIIIE